MRLGYLLVSTVVALGAASFVGCSGPEFAAGDTEFTIEDGYYTDQRDGNKYRVIKAGSEIWMAENLRYADSSASPNLKGNMWCPDGKASNCKEYGPLYSWVAAKDIPDEFSQEEYGNRYSHLQGICPDGFRLPTADDWEYLVKVADKYRGEFSIAEMLKSAHGWKSWGIDNDIYDSSWYGFDAKPAGGRKSGGGFLESGLFAFFWTATEIDESTASGISLDDSIGGPSSEAYSKEYGMSVRCIVTQPESVNWVGDESRNSFSYFYGSVEFEGRSYKTLKIGNYIWMAENLNIETENSRCYEDKEENCEIYGRLYTREEAMTVCPMGWKLPTSYQWMLLNGFAENDAAALRSVDYWSVEEGHDLIGFTALPAGLYENGSFSELSEATYFWASGNYGGNVESAAKELNYYSSRMGDSYLSDDAAASVRCIMDEKDFIGY